MASSEIPFVLEKPFLAFCGAHFYPRGGFGDVVDYFDTVEGAGKFLPRPFQTRVGRPGPSLSQEMAFHRSERLCGFPEGTRHPPAGCACSDNSAWSQSDDDTLADSCRPGVRSPLYWRGIGTALWLP